MLGKPTHFLIGRLKLNFLNSQVMMMQYMLFARDIHYWCRTYIQWVMQFHVWQKLRDFLEAVKCTFQTFFWYVSHFTHPSLLSKISHVNFPKSQFFNIFAFSRFQPRLSTTTYIIFCIFYFLKAIINRENFYLSKVLLKNFENSWCKI